PSHYAPKTPLRMVDDLKSFAPETNERCALLAWNPVKSDERFVAIRTLSEKQDLREVAANLFRFLRELDELDLDLIVAERVPAQGLGAAILDRLHRASHARAFAVNLLPLLLEQRNNRVGCLRIEFCAICFFNSANVSGEFDRCDLHAKTKPQIRNPMLASVTRRFNFSFDAALSEPARN